MVFIYINFPPLPPLLDEEHSANYGIDITSDN